jgi:hypothetical protein
MITPSGRAARLTLEALVDVLQRCARESDNVGHDGISLAMDATKGAAREPLPVFHPLMPAHAA